MTTSFAERTILCLIIVLASPSLVFSQSQIIPDTLDWRHYFPLAQGNVWEYQVSEGEPLLRREIIGDTVAFGQSYFLMEERSYELKFGTSDELELWSLRTLFTRYDTLGFVAIFQSPEEDTLVVPDHILFTRDPDGYFDLRLSFSDSLRYGEGSEDFYVTGGGYSQEYEISGITYEVTALKTFEWTLLWAGYAADIGLLFRGNLGGPSLTYARIDGLEYGVERATPELLAIVPDTLDWRGYVPLEAGNTWQYYNLSTGSIGTLEEWYETWDVVGSTTIDSLSYFNLIVSCDSVYAHPTFPFAPSCNPSGATEHWVRYDDQLANIVERQTVGPDSSIERLWFNNTFRLDADFNSITVQGTVETFGGLRVIGISNQSVFTTVKSIGVGSAIPTGYMFAHNIGLIRYGFNEGGGTDQKLIYAEIAGEEYGLAYRVSTQPTEEQAHGARLDLYPNPASSHIKIKLQLEQPGSVHVDAFDALGRSVHSNAFDMLSAGTHEIVLDTKNLAVGVYFVIFRLDNRFVSSKPLHIIR